MLSLNQCSYQNLKVEETPSRSLADKFNNSLNRFSDKTIILRATRIQDHLANKCIFSKKIQKILSRLTLHFPLAKFLKVKLLTNFLIISKLLMDHKVNFTWLEEVIIRRTSQLSITFLRSKLKTDSTFPRKIVWNIQDMVTQPAGSVKSSLLLQDQEKRKIIPK